MYKKDERQPKKYIFFWLKNKTAQPENIKVIEKYKIGVCVNADEPDAYLKGYYEILNHYDEFKKNVIETRKFLHWDNEKSKLIQLYQSIQERLNGTKTVTETDKTTEAGE